MDGVDRELTAPASTPARLVSASSGTSWQFCHQPPPWTPPRPSSFALAIGDAWPQPTDFWDIVKTLPRLALVICCSTRSAHGPDGLKCKLKNTTVQYNLIQKILIFSNDDANKFPHCWRNYKTFQCSLKLSETTFWTTFNFLWMRAEIVSDSFLLWTAASIMLECPHISWSTDFAGAVSLVALKYVILVLKIFFAQSVFLNHRQFFEKNMIQNTHDWNCLFLQICF